MKVKETEANQGKGTKIPENPSPLLFPNFSLIFSLFKTVRKLPNIYPLPNLLLLFSKKTDFLFSKSEKSPKNPKAFFVQTGFRQMDA